MVRWWGFLSKLSKSLAVTFTRQATTTKDSKFRALDIANEIVPAGGITHEILLDRRKEHHELNCYWSKRCLLRVWLLNLAGPKEGSKKLAQVRLGIHLRPCIKVLDCNSRSSEEPLIMPSADINPIIPGFSPDPSIVQIDGTFFLVTSTFHLFPGLPIYASKDLISWKHIGILVRPDRFRPTHRCSRKCFQQTRATEPCQVRYHHLAQR